MVVYIEEKAYEIGSGPSFVASIPGATREPGQFRCTSAISSYRYTSESTSSLAVLSGEALERTSPVDVGDWKRGRAGEPFRKGRKEASDEVELQGGEQGERERETA